VRPTLRSPSRSVALVGAVAVIALVLGACTGSSSDPGTSSAPAPATGGARPSSTARLSIIEPRDGQVFSSSTIPLRVSLKGARLVPATSTNLQPDEGHLHVILDDRLITMTSGLRENIPGVDPGDHLLRVEFVANDHGPFNPRVIDQVAFRVKP
jgi:hypothetical protein